MANEASFGIDFKSLLEGLKKAEQEITNMNETIKDGSKVSKESFKNLSETIVNAFKDSGVGVKKILDEIKKNAENSANSFEAKFSQAFSRIAVLRDTFSGAGNFIGGLIEGPKQMETALAQLSFVSKDVKNNLDIVKGSFSSISRSMPIKDTKELAFAMKDLSASGFNVKDSLKLIEEASRGAVAGNTDVVASVGALKNIIGAYGLEVGKSAEIQDKLFKASQMTGEAYGNISNAMSGAITNVATLGVNFDSFLGSVTALTKLNTPVQESIGLMDMASKQFTASLGSAYMKTHSLTDIMIGVYKKAGGEFNKIIDMGFKKDLANAILKIGQNADTVRGDLAELGNAAGTAMEAYELNANSMENMIAMISKNFEELKNSFATTLYPVISLVVEGVKNFMGWISALPSPIKFVVSGVSLLSGAIITLRTHGKA